MARPPRAPPCRAEDADPAASARRQLFHDRKLLRQALKRAKQFEVRKLCRRLRHAEELERAAAAPAEESAAAASAAPKPRKGSTASLALKLGALKAVPLEEAVHRVQVALDAESGPLSAARASRQGAAEDRPAVTAEVEWALRRLQSAQCVQDVVHRMEADERAVTAAAAEAEQKGAESGKEEHILERGAAGLTEAGPGGLVVPEDTEHRKVRRRRGPGKGQDLHVRPRGSGSRPPDARQQLAGSHKRSLEAADRAGSRPAPKARDPVVGKARKAGSRPLLSRAGNRMGQRERRRLAQLQATGAARVTGRSRSAGSGRDGKRSGHGHGQRDAVKGPGGRAVGKAKSTSQRSLAAVKSSGGRSAASSEKLHPSWAAKAAQAKLLAVAGSGQKIVFADDNG
eukprot:SM000005S17210  [mRNA]  locus=s5:864211:865992:+ [translate_table: standard]